MRTGSAGESRLAVQHACFEPFCALDERQHGPRCKPDARRRKPAQLGEHREHLAERHVLAAEDVAASGRAELRGEQMTARDVVDVDDVERSVDVGQECVR